MKPLLEISNLSISFQVRKAEFSAVKNLNLSIKENQIVGLVGESGSGKSVTAMSIMRFQWFWEYPKGLTFLKKRKHKL